jgi:hypothetical protein
MLVTLSRVRRSTVSMSASVSRPVSARTVRHLRERGAAALAALEVLVDPREELGGQRVVEVGRDELDELDAGHAWRGTWLFGGHRWLVS